MKNFSLLWLLLQLDIRILHGSPIREPTDIPSQIPTGTPTSSPSTSPSVFPSRKPSTQPTRKPSSSPTEPPSRKPSVDPTRKPSSRPTVSPSTYPTTIPSRKPSALPTGTASGNPSLEPSVSPSGTPSLYPTRTHAPSSSPSFRCANDLTFYAHYDIERTCRWIEESDDRNYFCLQPKIYLACPVTCGLCCRDDTAFTTRINNNSRDCEWIGADLERRLLYCSITTNGVREHCSKTCDRCFKEAPNPSASPSSAPTVTCLNSPSYYYLEEARTCNWIDMKSSRRKTFCQQKDVWQNCPLVCGVCCEDDPTFSFYVNAFRYDCGWVEQSNTGITYCNDDSGVFEACPKSCNNCRTDVVVPPTPEDITQSPTRSRKPSLRPTTSPSTSPTFIIPPSSAPTTSEPTMSPTVFCTDLPLFFYLETDRTCEFIDERRKRRTRFCAEEEVRIACPRTCGVCDCRDSLSFRFKFKKTKMKKCKFLSRKVKRKQKFCKFGGRYSDIPLFCPETCNKCRNNILYPTQSPTTSPPTTSLQPSLHPSSSPSNAPSTIPSSLREPSYSPTSLCLDDPSFNYLIQGRTCTFINSLPMFRNKYCPESEVATNCPKTCGVCCNDDPSFTYLIESGETEVCGYLTSSPTDTALRISKYCNHYQGVDEGCPRTCSNCPSSF